MKRAVHDLVADLRAYDPDPVSLAALMVGIIGALPAAAQMQQWIRGRVGTTSEARRVAATLYTIQDQLGHLDICFAAAREIIREAKLPMNSAFRLGHPLWLNKAQYKRYVDNTEEIFVRGARIAKAANRLEAMVSRNERDEDHHQDKIASELLANLNRLLHAGELSIGDALEVVGSSLRTSRQLIASMMESLREAYWS